MRSDCVSRWQSGASRESSSSVHRVRREHRRSRLLWHRLLRRSASESGRLRHRDGTHGRGDRAARGHDPERIPVPFPDSHSIPTLISSEFPRIDVCGRALRKDEKAPAIQDDVYLEGGRVDVGGCGPPQPPVGKRPPALSGAVAFGAAADLGPLLAGEGRPKHRSPSRSLRIDL